MDAVIKLGRFLLAIPMAVFGLFHFMNANAMAGMVPLPGGAIWVYLTGACLLAAAAAIVLQKQARLAGFLLGVLMLIFALSIHLPGVLAGGDAMQASMSNLLKDLGLAGGAWIYASTQSK